MDIKSYKNYVFIAKRNHAKMSSMIFVCYAFVCFQDKTANGKKKLNFIYIMILAFFMSHQKIITFQFVLALKIGLMLSNVTFIRETLMFSSCLNIIPKDINFHQIFHNIDGF